MNRGFYFAASFDPLDGATHPHRAHPLAPDANARVTALHLYLLIGTDAFRFNLGSLCQRPKVGLASLECAKPFPALAHAQVAVDLESATGSAFLKSALFTLIETLAHIPDHDAILSPLKASYLFRSQTEHHSAGPMSPSADAGVAVLFLRLSSLALRILSLAGEALNSSSSADARALSVDRNFFFGDAASHGAHPEGGVSIANAGAIVAVELFGISQGARLFPFGRETLVGASSLDAHLRSLL